MLVLGCGRFSINSKQSQQSRNIDYAPAEMKGKRIAKITSLSGLIYRNFRLPTAYIFISLSYLIAIDHP
jgi:hypothetical protein